MTEYQEVELKLYVPDLETTRQRLEALGAHLVSPRVYERNVRYENSEQSLSPNGIVVRLRRDTRTLLTYKGPSVKLDDGVRTRFEAEVEVSDFDTMEMILGKLGYFPYMVYEKYRTTYALDGADIVLDEMPYGNFVEIEGEAAAIHRLRAALHLADAPNFGDSYAVLFDRVRAYLKLGFHDLTFANFAGVRVPPEAFV